MKEKEVTDKKVQVFFNKTKPVSLMKWCTISRCLIYKECYLHLSLSVKARIGQEDSGECISEEDTGFRIYINPQSHVDMHMKAFR